jgi:hypothetical protein
MRLNVRQPLVAEQSANLINAATLPAAGELKSTLHGSDFCQSVTCSLPNDESC